MRYSCIAAKLTVLLLLLHASGAILAQEWEAATNRAGLDLRDFDLAKPDPQGCYQACVDEKACRSFTYAKSFGEPGTKSTPHCWLKVGIPEAKSDACCSSGIVRPGEPGDWVIEERTSGGIAGMSTTVVITSDGYFRRRHRSAEKAQEGAVPAAALRKINEAVHAAKPSAWKATYGHAQCCDMTTSSFGLEICGPDGKWARYSGTVYQPSVPPADMETLLGALRF